MDLLGRLLCVTVALSSSITTAVDVNSTDAFSNSVLTGIQSSFALPSLDITSLIVNLQTTNTRGYSTHDSILVTSSLMALSTSALETLQTTPIFVENSSLANQIKYSSSSSNGDAITSPSSPISEVNVFETSIILESTMMISNSIANADDTVITTITPESSLGTITIESLPYDTNMSSIHNTIPTSDAIVSRSITISTSSTQVPEVASNQISERSILVTPVDSLTSSLSALASSDGLSSGVSTSVSEDVTSSISNVGSSTSPISLPPIVDVITSVSQYDISEFSSYITTEGIIASSVSAIDFGSSSSEEIVRTSTIVPSLIHTSQSNSGEYASVLSTNPLTTLYSSSFVDSEGTPGSARVTALSISVSTETTSEVDSIYPTLTIAPLSESTFSATNSITDVQTSSSQNVSVLPSTTFVCHSSSMNTEDTPESTIITTKSISVSPEESTLKFDSISPTFTVAPESESASFSTASSSYNASITIFESQFSLDSSLIICGSTPCSMIIESAISIAASSWVYPSSSNATESSPSISTQSPISSSPIVSSPATGQYTSTWIYPSPTTSTDHLSTTVYTSTVSGITTGMVNTSISEFTQSTFDMSSPSSTFATSGISTSMSSQLTSSPEYTSYSSSWQSTSSPEYTSNVSSSVISTPVFTTINSDHFTSTRVNSSYLSSSSFITTPIQTSSITSSQIISTPVDTSYQNSIQKTYTYPSSKFSSAILYTSYQISSELSTASISISEFITTSAYTLYSSSIPDISTTMYSSPISSGGFTSTSLYTSLSSSASSTFTTNSIYQSTPGPSSSTILLSSIVSSSTTTTAKVTSEISSSSSISSSSYIATSSAVTTTTEQEQVTAGSSFGTKEKIAVGVTIPVVVLLAALVLVGVVCYRRRYYSGRWNVLDNSGYKSWSFTNTSFTDEEIQGDWTAT